MKSFAFWQITALAIGAFLGTALRPGPVEIAIVWGVAVWGQASWRKLAETKATA